MGMNAPGVFALSGNCSASIVPKVGYTVGQGSCKTLGSDTKARVTLDVSVGVDRHSSWFTRTGVTYTTGAWIYDPNAPSGWPRSARVDLGTR